MDQALISIVIPVYNVKDYLSECLESVINQTYRNLEIILVDDGSTDGSSEICDELKKRDSRISVIHKQNEGAARARKLGILKASGKFLCFVDSDDKVDSEMVEYLAANICESDLITTGCYYGNSDGSYTKRVDSFDPGVYQTQEELNYLIANMIMYGSSLEDGFLPYLMIKMYRTELAKAVIGDINETIIYAEDRDFLFRYILKCNSICVSQRSFYYYQYRDNSIMHSCNEHYMHDLNALYLSLKTEFERHPLRNLLLRQLQMFITSRIYNIPHFLGFDKEAWLIRYIFPEQELIHDKKVILYGAGAAGNSYYWQFVRLNICTLVMWIDKNWEHCTEKNPLIVSPDKIIDAEYDYVVVAVSKEQISREIKNELIALGVPEEKILNQKPVII